MDKKDLRPAAPPPPHPASIAAGPALEQLLDQLVSAVVERLAEALLPLLNAERAGSPQTDASPTRRLVTVDELVELFPAGKKPSTWKAWVYQRSRLGTVPGCHKIGNRLFFDPALTLPWLTNAADSPGVGQGVDLSGNQSNHADPMAKTPHASPRPTTTGKAS